MEASVGTDGILLMAGRRYRAAIGRSGIREHKQEGDGFTPAGNLVLRRVLYRADRLAKPRTALPLMPLAPHDGWCDDPSHAEYNRPVRLPHPARHEQLWRNDSLYDVIGVLGWNDSPVQRGAGSAIFLHVAAPGLTPTEGCVALSLPDVLALLADGLTSISVTA